MSKKKTALQQDASYLHIDKIAITNFEMNAAITAIKALEMMHKDKFMARSRQFLQDAEYKKELKYMKSIRIKFQKHLNHETP